MTSGFQNSAPVLPHAWGREFVAFLNDVAVYPHVERWLGRTGKHYVRVPSENSIVHSRVD